MTTTKFLRFSRSSQKAVIVLVFFVLGFGVIGCKSDDSHTSDPKLAKIDKMLNTQLPKGTPLSRVSYFLSSRGYILLNTSEPHALTAVVHQVDTDTLQPAIARVKFHFDNNDKLTSYEMTSAPNTALPQ